MKKLLALLLVVCMLVGLVACGGGQPATDPGANAGTGDGTGTGTGTGDGTGTGTGDGTGATEDPNAVKPMPGANPALAGKSLQIYGLGTEESYHNYDNFGKGNYVWMMRAAVEEWAALNNVTLVFKGSYNQNQNYGAFFLYGNYAASHKNADVGSRLHKFP